MNSASTVAVIGGAAGGIRVVNLGKGDIVGALAAHKEGESVEAIAFVGFAGTAEVVVTGSTDGKVCVWDLNTLKVRNELEHGVSRVLPRHLSEFNQGVYRNLLRVWPHSHHQSRTWSSRGRPTTLLERGTPVPVCWSKNTRVTTDLCLVPLSGMTVVALLVLGTMAHV